MCFFMSLSLSLSDSSAKHRIELWSTFAPLSQPDLLLQCNTIQTENIGTKWNLTRTAKGWQATCKKTHLSAVITNTSASANTK